MSRCFSKTPAHATASVRVLLLCSRGKTTRPQEWKDKERFKVKVHPDQQPVEESRTSKHKWMDVRWKNRNTAERLIHSLALDETRRSDQQEARNISDAKLVALRNSLLRRGYCRERKAYDPPDDVQQLIRQAFESAAQSDLLVADDWLNFQLPDTKFKFRFLMMCAKELDHLVPSSDLHLMKTLRDVVEFYETPVRGAMTYDHLVRVQNKDELPPNLHLVPQVFGYDPNSDFLGGIDAFPGNPEGRYSHGIRGKIKYPPVKQTIPWPDI